MADIALPFVLSGRDLLITDDPLNKVRYIVKSVPYVDDLDEYIRTLKAELRRWGINAKIEKVSADEIRVIVNNEVVM